MEQQELQQQIQNLEDLHRANPETNTLEIEFQSIQDLSPLLPMLSQFTGLKALSLHGNRLKNLPSDLPLALPQLEFLDISNNLISQFEEIIAPLSELENLANLKITLKSQQDQQFLIENLPKLQVLNDKSAHATQIQQQQQQQQEEEQPLQENNSNNDINNQFQQQEQEQDEDQEQVPHFNNNNYNSDQDQQQQQQVDQQQQQQQQNENSQIIDNNNNQQQQNINNSNNNNEITLKQEDLETVAILYDQIRELFRETNTGNDKELANQFDNHVKSVMMDLSLKLKENSVDFLINNNVLKAKYALFEICFQRTIQLLQKVDPRIVQIVQTLHDQHALIFKDQSSVIQNFKPQQPQQQQNSNSNSNNDNNSEAIEHWRSENQELKQQLATLEEENKKYLDLIIKRSKGDKEATLNNNNNTSINNTSNINNKQQQQQQLYNSNFNDSPQQQYSQQQGQNNNNNTALSSRYQSKLNFSAQQNSMMVGQTTIRVLTLRQLKEIIEEIYTSKSKYDEKYIEAKLPRETLEQHMYTFLNQKYGLKSLIIEWASAIINGIKKFSSEDNDIAVFGKILRNENDEEFRFVQSQVKNTIAELLKMYLRGKYPFKHNSEIKEMLASKINGWVFEEEATDIIKYMYSPEDSEQLLTKLQQAYVIHNQKTKEELRKLTREEQIALMNEKEKHKIQYFEFQKIILDFQLKSHEKFLKQFINLFRNVDIDHNGIIDENEFRSLLELMGQTSGGEEQIQRYLNSVDPYNHQQITFSQCVTLFSSEMVQNNNNSIVNGKGQQLSILQAIASQNVLDESKAQN